MLGGTVALIEVLALVSIVVAICWIILPFAILGTKPLLRELIAEMKRNNELLDQRLPALRARTPEPERPTALERLKGFTSKPVD